MKPAESYILKQPEPYKSILLHLQMLMSYTFPQAEMLYKWRIPCFYVEGRPICYFNQSKDFVDVGIWHASHLTAYEEHLVSENRKVVRSLRYKSLSDIDDELFIAVMREVAKHPNTSFLK
ncbi:DUF1801 domain-containing protein [Psychroserpens sp. BH13MA-6]